jgi:hypothetical protein
MVKMLHYLQEKSGLHSAKFFNNFHLAVVQFIMPHNNTIWQICCFQSQQATKSSRGYIFRKKILPENIL